MVAETVKMPLVQDVAHVAQLHVMLVIVGQLLHQADAKEDYVPISLIVIDAHQQVYVNYVYKDFI